MIDIKSNIKQVSYFNFLEEQIDSKWVSWGEICDRCSKLIREFGQIGRLCDINEINIEETDLCYDCFKFLLDNNYKYDKESKKDVLR